MSISQSIGRYSFNSTGGFYSNDVFIDFSIGQTIVIPLENNNNILTSGFQQPEADLKKKTDYKIDEINFSFLIFPNPVKNFAYISVTSDKELTDIFAKVFLIDGREIHVNQKIINYDNFCKIELDFSSLETSNYIIKTYINNTLTKSFKVIKN